MSPETRMQLDDLEVLLEAYTKLADDVARRRHDLVELDDRRRKRLALAAMDLVATNTINPLTAKPHSWTSALEAVKDTALATDLRQDGADEHYKLALAEIRAQTAWARVQYAVRPVYAHE